MDKVYSGDNPIENGYSRLDSVGYPLENSNEGVDRLDCSMCAPSRLVEHACSTIKAIQHGVDGFTCRVNDALASIKRVEERLCSVVGIMHEACSTIKTITERLHHCCYLLYRVKDCIESVNDLM